MIIPKYIQEMMSRSRFALGYGDAGYTIEIVKATPYARVNTLRAEVERLQLWVNRQLPEDEIGVPTMVINRVPKVTHYCNQYAIVTIFDPIMKELEKYIGGK